MTIPQDKRALDGISTQQWQALLAGPPEELARSLQSAAGLGDAHAQALLGQLYLDGRGVAQNAALAYRHFCQAAQQGHAMAMNMRGRCAEHGWGTSVDLTQAALWFLKAAQAGLDWGMYNYANLLATGRGVAQDHAQALSWYGQAAQTGHAKSLNLIGRYYEEGIVVQADRNIAFKYYRASAEAGDFRGQYSYACMLAERGRIDEAMRWMARVPQTSTAAFMKKIGYELQLSAHAAFRSFAQRLLHGVDGDGPSAAPAGGAATLSISIA
ncbi:tetratricopeptide repeat protein [Herbaspirillum lusitanum]|uniref:Tetratricopeptide repeat protein n=1 Tax=Herbaspirillum lusitanum TaxID=213312 RepID=A0ABW9A7Y1_9BURK